MRQTVNRPLKVLPPAARLQLWIFTALTLFKRTVFGVTSVRVLALFILTQC